MSKTGEVVDGKLVLTETGDTKITTMDKKEVEGKRTETQTKVDHLELDLATAQTEVTKWDDYLIAMDE